MSEKGSEKSIAQIDYERDTERIRQGKKARNVSPKCRREEHGDCDCSSLICLCECHRVVIDYFGSSVEEEPSQ